MVKAGYKQTEVGVIPEDWEVQPLSRFVERLDSGVSVNSVDAEYTPGQKGILKTSCVFAGEFCPDEAKVIQPNDLRRAKLNPCKNTILISRMNTPDLVAESGYIPETYPDLFVPDRLWLTKHRGDTEHSVLWLSKCLGYEAFNRSIKSAATGTSGSMKNLSKESFLASVVPCPRPNEQKAIAEALSDVDGLIAALEALIAKKYALRAATMQQILTGKIRLPGFGAGMGMKQSEVGEIPEDWEVQGLGSLCSSIVDGTHYTPSYVTNGVPFYSVENVSADEFEDVKYISEEEHERLITRCKPERGDVLLTRIGTLGKTKFIDWEAEASIYVSLALLKFSHLRTAKYFSVFSQSSLFLREVEKRSLTNATPQKINMDQIGLVPIPMPSELKEQQALFEILDDMNSEISMIECRLRKSRALKQGMMQELLTGRTRLV